MERKLNSKTVDRIRSSINKMVREVKEIELIKEAPTERAYFHTRFGSIIPERDERVDGKTIRRGEIRTYKQAVSQISKEKGMDIKTVQGRFTYKDYSQLVFDIKSILHKAKLDTAKRVYKTSVGDAWLKAEQYIKSGFITDITLKQLKTLSEEQVLQAFRDAEAEERKYRKAGGYDSTDSRLGWAALLTTELKAYLALNK